MHITMATGSLQLYPTFTHMEGDMWYLEAYVNTTPSLQ